jgi:putative ABC transport system permease protein
MAALAAFAIFTSDARDIAAYFVVGLGVLFAVFLGLGTALTWLARKMPRFKRPELALAISNIGAPGGLTRAVVLSLGSGLTLLVAVALADASLVAELTGRLPATSPSYFVLDIPLNERAAFEKVVQRAEPDAKLVEAPMLRGRLVTLKGKPTEEIKAPPSAQWVLNGDRGLSYATEVPEGSTVVKGKWWPENYDGEPLVSFEVEIARGLGLSIGDTVTVNVLGRNLTVKIANLREVNWESLAINFVMVFSPNALSAAPHNLLATLTLPNGASLAREAALAQAITKAFPTVTTIRVRDAINAFNAIFARVMTAVRVAGGVTLLAGALVLAGALATAQRRRLQLAAILKALGATRAKILTSHLIEYLLLGSATALIAVGLGSLAAWITLTQVMDVPFIFSPRAVVEALILSLGLVLIFGGYGTWRTLQAPAVPFLRSE